MSADHDPVVSRVLDVIPVAPPGDRFWPELSARLRSERPGSALRPVPPLPEDEATTLRPLVRRAPGHPGRRRRVLAGVAAAAVAAGAVLAVGALQDEGDDLRVASPADPSTSASAPDSPPVTNASSWTDHFRQVATEWVAAVSAGDADAAWARVGPQTREMLGTRAAFDGLMASAYREGWGAWDQPGVTATAVPVASEGPRIVAVVFQGTIPKEGPAAFHTAVLVVTDGEAGLVVEPSTAMESSGVIEDPAGGEGFPPVRPGDSLPVGVDHDAVAYAVAIDGVAVREAELGRDDRGTIRDVRVPELEPGPHSLVVVMMAVPASGVVPTEDDVSSGRAPMRPAGGIVAEAATFTVAA